MIVRNKGSREYWISREKDRRLKLEKNDSVFLGKQAGKYRLLQENYGKEVKAFYGAYGKAEEGLVKVLYTDAIKPLTTQEKASFINKINAEISRIGRTDDNYLNYLSNLKKANKIPRLQLLTAEAQKMGYDLARTEEKAVSAYLNQQTKAGYSTIIGAIEEQLGIKKLGVISETKIKGVLNTNWSGEMFSDRIWKQKEKLVSSISANLQDTFIRNHTHRKPTQDLKKRFDVKQFEAERLVRTESARVVEEASKIAMEDAEIKKYEYVAVEDQRTSEICGELDGKIFLLAEATTGVNYPPMHPNCRSTTIPVL